MACLILRLLRLLWPLHERRRPTRIDRRPYCPPRTAADCALAELTVSHGLNLVTPLGDFRIMRHEHYRLAVFLGQLC